MNSSTIFVKKYSNDEIQIINENEVWRYASYRGLKSEISEELVKVFDEVKEELKYAFSHKVCYRRMELKWENGEPLLPFSAKSKALARLLEDCNEIILFAATIGLEPDRYIAKQLKISPVKALIANAYGAERIEKLSDTFCDCLQKDLASENLYMTKRFSPGYADLPLQTQIEIFNLLDCNIQIGVSLNESLLMSPSKSVTAIVGLKKEKCENKAIHKCEECSNHNCEFRKQEYKK